LSGQAIPGNSLTKEPLKGDNYAAWEQTAILALKSYDKLGFVDGIILTPAKRSPNYPVWEMVNSMLCSWI